MTTVLSPEAYELSVKVNHHQEIEQMITDYRRMRNRCEELEVYCQFLLGCVDRCDQTATWKFESSEAERKVFEGLKELLRPRWVGSV